MKHMNIVVSVIIAAAILVAAYAVGLLVRYARTSGQSGSAVAVPIENPAALQSKVAQQSPGGRPAGGADANLAAKARQESERMREQMKGMTKEQKQRFTTEQARKRFGAGARSGPRKISPEEYERLLQKTQRTVAPQKEAANVGTAESEPNVGEPNKVDKG